MIASVTATCSGRIRPRRLSAEGIDGLRRSLADPRVAPALTVLLILTTLPNRWFVATPLIAAVAIATARPTIADRANFWYLIVGALGAGLHDQWFAADNHHYLVLYWTVAIALSTQTADPARARRRSARWLIAAVFGLAFGWKAISADFISGDFIEFTLLTDGRFAWLAATFGGVDPADLAMNRELLTTAVGPIGSGPAGGTDGASVVLAGGSTTLTFIAAVITWWTLLIEGLVALAFTIRDGSKLGRARDQLLIVFVATTYLAAPVVGFGWILAILGIASTAPGDEHHRRRLGYLVVLLLVRFAATPWNDVVIDLAS